MMIEDLIFSLDIGTRTVIGVVGKEENGRLNIIAAERVEHRHRAMMDGQVHDIEKVADAVREVKQRLEEKIGGSVNGNGNGSGGKLTRASIAAAGRVLRTKQVHVEANIEFTKNIDAEDISNLEMEGIQLAQYQLDEELIQEEKILYYCVGYSVVNYYLNQYVISNLLGHKGKLIGADLIATFLPNTVVDSLYAVMRLAGLEVGNLTLEPIAAINVAIPKDLRLLNLALVDIGAGTSDIAITREGTVVGFDMVPVAGDEITEAICHRYIVDFNSAEKIKTSKAKDNEEINFLDILGNSKRVKYEELLTEIGESIDYLAETISNKILEFNQKPPQAVFLIGGGSQVRTLNQLIAKKLGLPEERVAVRKSNIIQDVIIHDEILEGPDAITPIGIAVTTLTQPGYGFINVKVNGSKLRLFNSRKLHVADALILAGYKPSDMIGKAGKSLKYDLNGRKRVVSGEFGKASEILVNGSAGNMQTLISNGDEIIVKIAEDGKAAKQSIMDLLFKYNGECEVYANGEPVGGDYEIADGDLIVITELREHSIPKAQEPPVMDINTIHITVNNTPVTLSARKNPFIFVDIFDFYAFDLKILKGKLVTKINGINASFTEELHDGDQTEVYWG